MASAALLIGANLPDVDVVSYAWGETAALSFRRGWTHGVLALAVWPLLLTGGLILWDRWRSRSPAVARPPLRPWALLGIAGLAVLSHPLLDTLNVYGVRWLAPFSDRWYYGDTLFIVDPWLWLILGVGAWLGARQHRCDAAAPGRPALLALAVSTGYILAMGWIGREVRGSVGRALRAAHRDWTVLLVAPEPLNPFRRRFVAGNEDAYGTGSWDLFGGGATLAPEWYARLEDLASEGPIREAIDRSEVRRFLSWARFPTAQARDGGTGRVWVDFLDLRYTTAPGTFGALTIDLERRTPTPSEP